MANQTTPVIQVKDANVGIGTTTPAAKLVVSGSGVEAHVNNGDTNTLTLGNFSGGRHFIKSINLGVALTPLTLQASAFTFDTGNVLIGTTTDSVFKLDVAGNARFGGTDTYNSITINNNSNTGGGGILLQRNGVNNAYLGALGWYQGTSNSGAVIGTDNSSYPIVFYTNVEQMRIAGGGNVLIGTTTDSGYKLDVNGTSRFSNTVYVNKGGRVLSLGVDFANHINWDSNVDLALNISNGGTGNVAFFGGGATAVSTLYANGGALFTNSVTASSLIKSGGTSSQYLMADGSTSTTSNVAPRYVAAVNVSQTTYTQICTIVGGSLASAVNMSLQGTSGNVVVNVTAQILVNHSQDISITTTSGFYSQLNLRVISNNNETYSVEAQVISGVGATTDLNIEVFPLNSESVTFGGSPITPGTTLVHTTRQGFYISASEGISISSGNDIYAAGNVGIGTTAPAQRLHVSASGAVIQLTDTGKSANNSLWFQATSQTSWAIGTANNASSGTKMVIMDNGNIGFGVSSASTRLDVIGAGATLSGSASYQVRFLEDQTNYRGILLGYDTSGSIGIIAADTASPASTLAFWTYSGSAWGEKMRVIGNGNVLIGTTTDNGYKLSVNGSGYFNGIGYFENRVATNNSFSDANNVRVLKPLGGSRNSFTPTETGAIKITYPVGYTNTMHRVKVNIYNYAVNQAYTVYFGGYNYSPGPFWTNVFAYTIGPSSTNFNPTVRFGYDGTNMVVYIGELNTSWSYPQFFIEEVETGFNLSSQFATDAWSIGLEASAFQNVTDSIANTLSTNWARNGSFTYNLFGNVGVGTTSPASLLQLVGLSAENQGVLNVSNTHASGGLYYPAAKIRNTRGDHSFGIISEFSIGSVGGTDRPSILFYTDAAAASWNVGQVTGAWGIADSFGIGYRANNVPSTFNSWPTNYFTINTNGNVLIGTTTDSGYKLEVNGSFYSTSGVIQTATNASEVLVLRNSGGNSGSVQGITHLGINFFSVGTNSPVRITAYQESTSGYRGGMYFSTRGVNSDSAPSEAMRISPDQLVGIGTSGTTAADYRLTVDSTGVDYAIYSFGSTHVDNGALGVGVVPSATIGRIDASNDIVAFSTSDRRLKDNITPIANALDKVKALTGVEFDWKAEHKEAHGHSGRDTGIIAQEVQAVMPTAVRTNDTGYLAVRYEKLIGLLIEANKELADQVANQQVQIDELKKLIK
jgi:hypothetical protein